MYGLLKPLLFLREPESVHEMALRRLERMQSSGLGRAFLRAMSGHAPEHPVETMRLHFRHPVGMAAGFDKDARVVIALQELGMSFVEVGTVTPRPQSGNSKPRIWRFPEAGALVNALGFPGEGMEMVHTRLTALRTSGLLQIPVGVNLGKNYDTPLERAVDDYRNVLERLHELADFFVVNVSSPNTPGLRNLQSVENLRPLLTALHESCSSKPLLLKVAPDLADDDLIAVSKLVRELNLAGIVAGNTTIRRDLVKRAASLDRGGLSGAPLYPRTLAMIRLIRPELADHQTLIAVGGISSPAQVRECLSSGANLVEIYTSFIYRGPRCVKQLLS